MLYRNIFDRIGVGIFMESKLINRPSQISVMCLVAHLHNLVAFKYNIAGVVLPCFSSIQTVLQIRNLSYQGIFIIVFGHDISSDSFASQDIYGIFLAGAGQFQLNVIFRGDSRYLLLGEHNDMIICGCPVYSPIQAVIYGIFIIVVLFIYNDFSGIFSVKRKVR